MIPHEPTEFLMSTLPATTRSNPLPKKPPMMGTELLTAYFAALKERPSYVAEVMPCTVKKTVKAASATPSTHLMTLANSAEKFCSRTCALILPTMCSTQMREASGKTMPATTETIPSLKNSTAGR